MGNITLDLRMVRRLSEPSPVPGHDLLIFDQVRDHGRVYRETLRDGEVLKQGWKERLFGRDSEPIAYAVSRDQTFEHKVAFLANLEEEVFPISVEVGLSLSVAAPQPLVEQIDRDPVQRLAQEVKDLARRALKPVSLVEATFGRVSLETKVLHSKSPDAHGELTPHLELLRRSSSRSGLELRTVRVSYRLPEEAAKWLQAKLDEEGKRIVHEGELKDKERTAELETREKKLRLEQKGLDDRIARGEIESKRLQDGYEQMQRLQKKTVDALGTALEMTAAGTDSVPKLKHLLQEALSLSVAMPSAAVPTTRSTDGQIEGSDRLALASRAKTMGRCEEKVSSAVDLADQMSCGNERRGLFLSFVLHLLAEGMRGQAADGERVGEWKEELESLLDDLEQDGAFLSAKHSKEAFAWLDSEALRNELSEAGDGSA